MRGVVVYIMIAIVCMVCMFFFSLSQSLCFVSFTRSYLMRMRRTVKNLPLFLCSTIFRGLALVCILNNDRQIAANAYQSPKI